MRTETQQTLIALLFVALLAVGTGALAQDDTRTRQLRLLCAQLSGDLTDPGGIAAFKRCLTQNPIDEIKRDNNIGGRSAAPPIAADRPGAVPPAGFGRDSRKILAEGVERFQTLGGKTFLALDRDGIIWSWVGYSKDAKKIEHDAAQFFMTDDGFLFVRDRLGTLWRERDDPNARQAIDKSVAEFAVTNGNLVYAQSKDGTLTRQTVEPAASALVDKTVAAFQPLDSSTVFVLGTDHKLWRETGDAHTRSLEASNIAKFQYVPDAETMYVLTTDGALWRQQKSTKPEAVDHDVAVFQAVDMNLLFVLGKDGRLWQELGRRDAPRVLVDHDVIAGLGNAAFQATDQQHVYVLASDHRLWGETMPPGR